MEHRSDCEQLIADLVENHFGIEKHLKGCTYLKEAIETVQNNWHTIMWDGHAVFNDETL